MSVVYLRDHRYMRPHMYMWRPKVSVQCPLLSLSILFCWTETLIEYKSHRLTRLHG